QLGEVWVKDDLAIPYFFTGQKTRLNLQLREPDSQPVKLYVALYKDGELLQRSDLEFGFTNPTIDKSVDFSVDAPPGSYVMSVVNEQEKVYAATKLDVLDVDIGANSTQWAQGKFTFILSAGGKPLSPRYVSVKMDGRLPRDYSAQDLSKIAGKSFLTYDYPDKIETGDHVFSFTFGDYQKDVGINYYKSPQMWENPWVVGIGLLSLAIFCMGYFLKRPEAIRYGLDVPDFPPISAIKIPVKREAVLEIFDNVNLGYSWRYMPLRSEELKGGFRKLTYNGKPILIGDFNLDRILSKLKVEGLVKNELDYWGLLRWEKESGHSMHYLTIYRIMRNVFVNNAVKFSKMDSMPDCDIKIVAGKEEIYLHIMEAPADRVAHRALATAKKGTTLVIFKTQDELDSFSASLTSTSKLAVGIKMEIQNRNIILMTAKISLAAYLKQILT
ncbi:MAG: hypothetical protein NT051_06455, partial [Candidatus Micrarchaeota archaeon]|nr:hypothetical protein [Candidatus Micrarchaeota archaeon]